jgi:hypothetical protein
MAYANQTGLLSGTLSTLLLLPLALPLMLAGGVGAALDSLRKW